MTKLAFSFTRNRIRDLVIPKQGRTLYRDTSTTGLRLRITSNGVKTFSYLGRINRQVTRVTIGEFGTVSVKDAQIEAGKIKALFKQGIDPTKLKQASEHAQITLKQCLVDYLACHNKLSPKTAAQYRSEVKRLLSSWYDKPLANITRSDVAKRHREISKRTPPTANRIMRVLRALFNFANQEYEDENGKGLFPDNPVHRLSHQRLWNKTNRRTGVLRPHQIKPWLEATERLPEFTRFGDILRDYLQLVLFTGLRKSEALNLKWINIDFKGRTLLVPNTKNKKPHMLPLSDYLLELLERRYKGRINEYVFPACYGSEHLKEPVKGTYKVQELTGIKVILHDLRRTFITIAESLDLSMYSVKHLVNHSMANDVTAGYIVWDVERLREPMQRITDYITKAAELKESAAIITLPMRKVK